MNPITRNAIIIGSIANGLVRAKTVNLSLEVDDAASSWQAFIEGDDLLNMTAGLAGIGFDVIGTAGMTVTSSRFDFPLITEIDGGNAFQKGFGLFRSNGKNGMKLTGAQNTVSNRLSPLGSGTDAIIRGVGLEGPALVASGTFESSGAGSLQIAGSASTTTLLPAFVPSTSFGTFSPDVVLDTAPVHETVIVPGEIIISDDGLVRMPSVNLSLDVDNAASTWQAFTEIDDPDNMTAGLAGISFDVVGTEGMSVVSSNRELPLIADFEGGDAFQRGFSLFRSDGDHGLDLTGAQDSISNGLSPAGNGGDAIIRGVGLDGSALLASGTFESGGTGSLVIQGAAESTSLLPALVPSTSFATLSPEVVIDTAPVEAAIESNDSLIEDSPDAFVMRLRWKSFIAIGDDTRSYRFVGSNMLNVSDVGVTALSTSSVDAQFALNPEPSVGLMLGLAVLLTLRKGRESFPAMRFS